MHGSSCQTETARVVCARPRTLFLARSRAYQRNGHGMTSKGGSDSLRLTLSGKSNGTTGDGLVIFLAKDTLHSTLFTASIKCR